MNQHLSIKHTNAAGAESPVFWHKTIHHQFVRFEKIVHRCGVQPQQQFIGFIGIQHFFDLIRITKDTFAIQNCRNLFQGQGIMLNRKRVSQHFLGNPDEFPCGL